MHERLHTWILDHQASARTHLEHLVSINTHSYNVRGLTDSAEVLRGMFDGLGTVTVEAVPPARDVDDRGGPIDRELGPLVRVRHQAPGPRIMLIGHHDTVFSPEVAFAPDWGASPVTGPGVADAKGGLVQVWLALGALAAVGGAPAWELLIVPDEEIGSPGSGTAIRSTSRTADVGFGFEPSFPSGDIAAARAGSGNFAVVVAGRAAHAGRDHAAGRNAIVAAADVIKGIAALTSYPDILANPGVVAGGTAVNIVPDRTVVRANVRVRTMEQARGVTAALEDLVGTFDGRDGFTATLHGGFGRPPKPRTAPYEALIAAVIATAAGLGIDLAAGDTGGVCDGNLMADEGLVNVDNLGPVGGNLHQVSEYLHYPSVAERALLTATLLTRAESLVRKEPTA